MTERVYAAAVDADHGIVGKMRRFDEGQRRVRLIDEIAEDFQELVAQFDVNQIDGEFQNVIKTQIELVQDIGHRVAGGNALVVERGSFSDLTGKVEEIA